MKRILLGGAGGAPTNNVIKSLQAGGSQDLLIGMSSSTSDLFLADVAERYPIVPASDPDYPSQLKKLVDKCRPNLLHPQHDFEVRAISRLRSELEARGIRLYLPSVQTVENSVDKFKSYGIWKSKGVPVPETRLVRNPTDLEEAAKRFEGRFWLRATEGGGGTGSLPIRALEELDFARLWIDRFKGWGSFTVAEMLTQNSVTFMSLWHQGELVVAQTRHRLKWNFADRTLSGVTGITGVAATFSDDLVTKTALDSIAALDSKPHGVFSVDMTYDFDKRPRVTEMNIGRFFTTVHFFTRAGLNFPQIYRDIALENRFPVLSKRINPLPDGLVWIRGMDIEPVLTTLAELEKLDNRGKT